MVVQNLVSYVVDSVDYGGKLLHAEEISLCLILNHLYLIDAHSKLVVPHVAGEILESQALRHFLRKGCDMW